MSIPSMPVDIQQPPPPVPGAPVPPDEIEIVVESEHVDDEHDKPRNPKAPAIPESNPEIDNVSEKVNKRIGQLTWRAKQAERERDEQRRFAEEGFRYAQAVHQANQELAKRLQENEKFKREQLMQSAKARQEAASERLTRAHETADAAAIAKATAELSEAAALAQNAELLPDVNLPPIPQFQIPQPVPQAVQNPLRDEWLSRNSWFQLDPRTGQPANQQTREVIAWATLVEANGHEPTEPSYWQQIDNYLAAKSVHTSGNPVPASIPAQAAPPKQPPSQVVAGVPQDASPVSAQKSAPKRYTLTRSQETLIKRLFPGMEFGKAAKLYIEQLRQQEQENG